MMLENHRSRNSLDSGTIAIEKAVLLLCAIGRRSTKTKLRLEERGIIKRIGNGVLSRRSFSISEKARRNESKIAISSSKIESIAIMEGRASVVEKKIPPCLPLITSTMMGQSIVEQSAKIGLAVGEFTIGLSRTTSLRSSKSFVTTAIAPRENAGRIGNAYRTTGFSLLVTRSPGTLGRRRNADAQ